MRFRFAVTMTILVVAGGCRRVGPDESEKGRPFVEDRTTVWYPDSRTPIQADRPNLGPIDGGSLVKYLGDGPRQLVTIVIEPEDTLELYVRWSGRSLEELFRWNPDVRKRGLIPGEGFRLELTPGEFDRFNGTRRAFLAEARALREMGREVAEVILHTVCEGETLKDILDRYPTSLEMLEKLNPKLRLTGIRAGQVLRVPILADPARDSPALPGPKPPAPPPIPVPPGHPKPQTVQPDPPPSRPDPIRVVENSPSSANASAPVTIEYVVQPGDTAWVIARHRFQVGLEALAEANPGIDLERLRPGMKLLIPTSR